MLWALPSTLSFVEGALTDSIAVVLHCFNRIKPKRRSWNVAIVGDGPIGLLCVLVASVLGAREVVVLGKHEHRLEFAQAIGASEGLLLSCCHMEQLKDRFDITVEAVGGRQSDSLDACINLVSPGGTVGVLGVFDADFLGVVPFRQTFYKETRVWGSNSYSTWKGEREFGLALRFLEQRHASIGQLVTHCLPLDRFDEGLKIVRTKAVTGAVKLVFEP